MSTTGTKFRVIDLQKSLIDPYEVIIEDVDTPEKAAEQALGIQVIRSGARRELVARVYWQVPGGSINMVRLYRRAS